MGSILFPTRRDRLRREARRREDSKSGGYRIIPGVKFHPPNEKNRTKSIGDYFKEQDAKQQRKQSHRHLRPLEKEGKREELQAKKSGANLFKSRSDYASGAKFKSHGGRVGA